MRRVIIHARARLFVLVCATFLCVSCDGGAPVVEMPLEYCHVQDLIYNPDDGCYTVEYDNVFNITGIPRFERDHVVVDVEQDVFMQLVKDMKCNQYEHLYFIKIRHAKGVDDYVLEVVRKKAG